MKNTLRVGAGSTGPHKPGLPGATPGPATTGYANRKSGEVENLVTLQVRLLSRSLTRNGLVVQRDDTSAACWKRGFNSRRVHWQMVTEGSRISGCRNAPLMRCSPVEMRVRLPCLPL